MAGVELLIDVPREIMRFYALTSDKQDCGRQIVGTVVVAVPEDWFLALLMDWSGGFWQKAGWWSRGRTAVRNTPDSLFSGRTTGQGFGPERQLNEHFEPASEGREPVGSGSGVMRAALPEE